MGRVERIAKHVVLHVLGAVILAGLIVRAVRERGRVEERTEDRGRCSSVT